MSRVVLSDYEKENLRQGETTEFAKIFYRLLDREIKQETENVVETVPDNSKEILREIKGMQRARDLVGKYINKEEGTKPQN